MNNIKVIRAQYGTFDENNSNKWQTTDVTQTLQKVINTSGGYVEIDNNTMETNSPSNNTKHFAAIIEHNSTPYFFACSEGQTVNFNNSSYLDINKGVSPLCLLSELNQQGYVV